MDDTDAESDLPEVEADLRRAADVVPTEFDPTSPELCRDMGEISDGKPLISHMPAGSAVTERRDHHPKVAQDYRINQRLPLGWLPTKLPPKRGGAASARSVADGRSQSTLSP